MKQILNEAAEYHKEYLLQRFKSESDPEPEKKLPKHYICKHFLVLKFHSTLLVPITTKYWKGLLATMHKDFFVEELTIGSSDGKDITYISGYIINMVSASKCAVQSDGRILPVNQEQSDSILAVRRRPLEHQRTFTLGRIQPSDGPASKVCQ